MTALPWSAMSPRQRRAALIQNATVAAWWLALAALEAGCRAVAWVERAVRG